MIYTKKYLRIDSKTHYYTWGGKRCSTTVYYKVWGIYQDGNLMMEMPGSSQMINLFIEYLNMGKTKEEWSNLYTTANGQVKNIRELLKAELIHNTKTL